MRSASLFIYKERGAKTGGIISICYTQILKSLFCFLHMKGVRVNLFGGPGQNEDQTWNRTALRITGVSLVFFGHNDEARFGIT